MKKYVMIIFMMIMSFSTYAENEQNDIAMETCQSMAQEQELTGENAQSYISECVKTFDKDEKDEKEDSKG